MKTLMLNADSKSYPIHIGSGLLQSGQLLAPALKNVQRAVVVTNQTVAPLYLERLIHALNTLQVEVLPVVLPDGEEYKNWESLSQIFDALLEHNVDRKTPLLALGGGVVGDMTGFAASVYQRGVPFIQIPTTLLSQVDSSVGGKTAINHPLGKNMIGSFYQPELVLADISTLATLSDREFSAGLAEVIKYGIGLDVEFLGWLETNIERLMLRDEQALTYAIARSCEIKAEVVARDERENDVRALLNLGHTFGHAIETGMGYGVWLHGEAVAAGMRLAAEVSRSLGYLSDADVARVVSLLRAARLPIDAPGLGFNAWMALMGHDKKVLAGKIRFVLIRRLGDSFVSEDVPETILQALLR